MSKKRGKKFFFAKTAAILFLVIDGLLSFLFFWQYNLFISYNFEIENYQKEIAFLDGTNENLGTNFLERHGLERVEEMAREMHFEKTSKIHYLQAPSAGVAAK